MSEVQSLRILSPNFYQYFIEKFEKDFHIQPYDIQINAIKKDNGLQIIVNYGERFDEKSEQFFEYSSIEQKDKKVNAFIQETGEACKKVLIDDYFRMMTP